MGDRIELLCGCYEQILFGYHVQLDGEQWTAAPDFTHHAHTASLSVVAANNRFVITGSKDETIQIYDMKKKVEHGVLLHHNGSITCLEFYGNTHLLSGAEDGLICVWNTKKWECQQTFKAHKGHVSSLSIHPSGKLALSVGTDKTLRTWNLVDGRSAFIKNIKQNAITKLQQMHGERITKWTIQLVRVLKNLEDAHIVQWSPSGETYVVVMQDKGDVYQLETAAVIGTIHNPKRISSIRFITDTLLAVAGDEDLIRLYDTDSQNCVCEYKAHETRVKSLHSFESEDYHVIVSSSSDGYVKMWKIDLNKVDTSPTLLCEVSTSARLTCLSVWLPGVSDNKAKPTPEATAKKETKCPKKKTEAPRDQTENLAAEQEGDTAMVHRKRKLTDNKKIKKKPNKD